MTDQPADYRRQVVAAAEEFMHSEYCDGPCVASFHSVASALADAVLPVRDEEMATLRQRAELAETAIVNCFLALKTKMNLSCKPPANPSEWQRGWWAAVEAATACIDAPYANAALELLRLGEQERAALLGSDLRERLADAGDLSRRAEQAEAAIARVRRLCDLAINCSIRVQAVEQAEDTLAALDREDPS